MLDTNEHEANEISKIRTNMDTNLVCILGFLTVAVTTQTRRYLQAAKDG